MSAKLLFYDSPRAAVEQGVPACNHVPLRSSGLLGMGKILAVVYEHAQHAQLHAGLAAWTTPVLCDHSLLKSTVHSHCSGIRVWL